MKQEIEILYHSVSKEGIKSLNSRIKSIVEIKLPETTKQLQAYLGIINYCRKFLPNISIICKPLYDALKIPLSNKEVKEKLHGQEAATAFKEIRELIKKDTLLTMSDKTHPFILTKDTSKTGIGAILPQVQNGVESSVAFHSVTHSKTEANYSTTDQELMAVITAIKHFRHYFALTNE